MSIEIESHLATGEVFRPSEAFVEKARVKSMDEYLRLYRRSIEQPDAFWLEMAAELDWAKKPTKVLNWQKPYAKWFEDGQINIAYNCLDRHLQKRGNKIAIEWVGEPGERRSVTYRQMYTEVCQFASAMKRAGIGRGDRVAIYMPMIPEAVVAMLACMRIGAIHTVVFGGFSADALRQRIEDTLACAVLTADGSYRRGKILPLKPQVDQAIDGLDYVKTVVVAQRADAGVAYRAGRDVKWADFIAGAEADCPAEPMNAEDTSFILYTSGTTGKPKGIQHATAGYLLGAYLTTKYIFDIREDDIYWCTADIGWVTGHTYTVYGALANGATTVIYEGAPTQPDWGRLWQIIDQLKVTIFYTAPTAIRSFIQAGDQWVTRSKLDSLRLLGSVGEPINPAAWLWYHRMIGKGRCPIVDTWWQTETGSIMMSTLPGAMPAKPGAAGLPFFGVVPKVVDKNGNDVERGQGGFFVLAQPWPSMLRTVYGDSERYIKQYWSDIPQCYFAGDGSHQDADGYYWFMGRIDDVVNVSGHRLGTMEVESAIVSHEKVSEAAVVARPDELTGQALVAYVVVRDRSGGPEALRKQVSDHVAKEIGSFARPADIFMVESLPKTRSGKIMRRLLRDIASGKHLGDVTTLEDAAVVQKISDMMATAGDEE